ncbi:hypothetical protein MMC07_003427 [Pseudocyphellaria aurata]|nr:hypothetical protein [Pseudocyphellaria aurata]
MNPFRSRKKSHDAGDQRSSIDANNPPVPSLGSKAFKRNKKPLPEPKPQPIDLATALPSSDEFRTSLILPNLSARFSMLREQDDPTSKIGKANDDSVLFPKRASRLNLFNRNELTDIAEVDSARSSMRPPFAPWGTSSYGSFESYGTEDDGSRSGSVMSRSRPGEGNTLFGGRQKIYKINVGGTCSSRTGSGNEDGRSSTGMGGKFLYGDDVSSSAFQKLREQEKEEREMADLESKSRRSSKEHERPSSPSSVTYDPFRETTSSMASAPSESRISTAATSVASQRSMHGGHGNLNGSPHVTPLSPQSSTATLNPDRQNHKSRRLYGQGLDQHISDQQSSAMSRLESLHRQRAAGGTPASSNLPQPQSANSLNERFQRSGKSYASNESRAASPPSDLPPRPTDFEVSLLEERTLSTRSQLDSGYGRSPPVSPPTSPIQNPTLVASLEPNDVGKATASGAFNKPRKQYDDQQYLQRQLQLQQGRETPPLPRSFSPAALSIDEKAGSRSRDGSFTSTQSRSGSLKAHQGPQVDDHAAIGVPANLLANIKDHPVNQYHSNGVAGMGPGHASAQPGSGLEASQMPDVVSPRYREASPKIPMDHTRLVRPRDMDHPLYRTQSPASAGSLSEPLKSSGSETIVSQDNARSMTDPAKARGFDTDSPTLGPTSGLNGLNGLVRAHLRNDSGQSSIYPEQSPDLASRFPIESPSDAFPLGNDSEVRQSETPFHKEAWDHYRDSSNQRLTGLGIAESNREMPQPLSLKARQILDQASALRNHESSKARQTLGVDKVQRLLGGEAPRTSQESSSSSWQDHLKAHHARGGSNETAKERESLANELAERRRMVRDNLKSFVENESRSASPMPGARTQDNSPSKPGTAFGILKSKGSKGSLASRHEQPSKAMKMLGMSNPNGSSRSGHDSFVADELDQPAHHARDDRNGSLGARAAPPGFQHPNFWQRDFRDRSQEDLSRRTSPSSKASRDRSNVESPERRPNSSNERINGESKRTNFGVDRINGYHPDVPQYRKFSNGPRPAPELMESMPSHQIPPDPQSASRLRSNSRTNNTRGYFEQRDHLQSSSTNNLSHSPGTPYSPRSISSPHETSPSVPSSTMPVMVTSVPHQSPRLTSRRKKSINKQDISDPTFLSSTSSVGTIDLPPGASLSNGMEPPHSGHPPPVPPFNPRRIRTQTLRQALGRTEKPENSASATIHENLRHERSNFSADDTEPSSKSRQRLRKTSSEGGSMNAKARQQALMEPGPAVPSFPHKSMVMPSATASMVSHPHPGVHRFPNEMAASVVMPHPSIYPHPGVQRCPNGNDVPASAVMF